MFVGALVEVHPGLEQHEGDGFVIITAASDSGMIDIHDRNPLVLSPDIANEWLDPELPATRAKQIAKKCCRPSEEFE
jgi:putative SOS response-associated peptidase YedK